MRGLMRPTWDDTWMNVARVMAHRSSCSRARVGAVIVDPNNRIVATGYNNPPANFDRPWEDDCDGREAGFCTRGKHGPTDDTIVSYSDCLTIHAETNALMFCDRRDREGGTIYVTCAPCLTCAKAVANSGLKRIVWDHHPEFDYRNIDQTYTLLTESGLTITVLPDGPYEPQDPNSEDSLTST